jgi:hypothetical protein
MPTFASDICYDAVLSLGRVMLGEPLTDAESAVCLRTWQQLIDSFGLDRANIHTIRQDRYPIHANQDIYTLGYDPLAPTNQITAASNASAAVLTLTTAHGITVGRTCSVYIQNGAGNWQAINGGQLATALDATTVSIPVDSSAFGALTGDNILLQVAGEWSFTRPTKITRINLDWNSNFVTHMTPADANQYGDISIPNLFAPPQRWYDDEDSPLSKLYFYPKPNRDYTAVVYSEQALEKPLALTDQVVFAQGYERYWVSTLAIEVAPKLGAKPSPTLLGIAADAASKVMGKNRRSPALVSDSALVQGYDFYDDARYSGLHS